MSDWSSFEKDKQIRDAWRQYLSESTQIDERAGFFAGMEAGARKAAGIGQRPDTKAPGVAGKVRPGAMQLLKKKIREALDALLESTTKQISCYSRTNALDKFDRLLRLSRGRPFMASRT